MYNLLLPWLKYIRAESSAWLALTTVDSRDAVLAGEVCCFLEMWLKWTTLVIVRYTFFTAALFKSPHLIHSSSLFHLPSFPFLHLISSFTDPSVFFPRVSPLRLNRFHEWPSNGRSLYLQTALGHNFFNPDYFPLNFRGCGHCRPNNSSGMRGCIGNHYLPLTIPFVITKKHIW